MGRQPALERVDGPGSDAPSLARGAQHLEKPLQVLRVFEQRLVDARAVRPPVGGPGGEQTVGVAAAVRQRRPHATARGAALQDEGLRGVVGERGSPRGHRLADTGRHVTPGHESDEPPTVPGTAQLDGLAWHAQPRLRFRADRHDANALTRRCQEPLQALLAAIVPDPFAEEATADDEDHRRLHRRRNGGIRHAFSLPSGTVIFNGRLRPCTARGPPATMRPVKPTVPEKTLAHLEWHRVRERLAHHCRGPLAHRRALALDLAEDAGELDRRLRLVAEARRFLDTGRAPPLGEVPDVRAVAGLAARGGILEPEALSAVGLVLEVASRCSRYLDDVRAEAPTLAEEGDALPRRVDLARALLEAVDERGQIADGASGDLGHLRLRVSHLHVQLKSRIDGLVSDPEVASMLQDDYYTIREDRYVLPVRSGHKNHVPGIVHGWSQTAQTVFIEPQAVVEANNALRFAQADVEREVQRILTRLSARVGEAADEIVRAVEHLATIDLALAAASLSSEMDATAPLVTEAAELSLRRARHPLLVLEGIPVVPNDLQLGGGQRALVITGPNTGGKTVALKTAGLCVLMALSGLHLPCAHDSVVPRVPGLFTDIGDEQSLQAHLSTFSGHVANLRTILDALLPGGLVLLDELVVGTDPVQGSALAQAIAETLVERGALAIVTTHYEGLKALPFTDPRFRNGAMGIDPEGRAPTYRLRLDVPGTSSALVTARRLGLDPAIVDRAETLAGAQHRSLEAVVSRLERDAEAARQAREASEADRRQAEKARRAAEDHERMWRERLKAGLAKERSAALTEARRLRDDIRRLKAQLEEPEMRKDVQKLAEHKSRAEKIIEKVVAQEDAARAAQAGPAVEAAALRPGLRVYVVSLGCEGVIERVPDGRGKVDVRAGLLAMKLDVTDLRLAGDKNPSGKAAPPPPKSPPPAARVSPGSWADVTPQAPHNTVDVRGMRTHEAIAVTERFLDAQVEREATVAYVIHGHGTGALKKELRQWLRTTGYARDFRPGEQHQGGDGVTAVLLV